MYTFYATYSYEILCDDFFQFPNCKSLLAKELCCLYQEIFITSIELWIMIFLPSEYFRIKHFQGKHSKINNPIQGRLKIWTEHSHWFLLTLKPLEILWQNFQHFYNLERYEFWPNLKGVAQKLDLPRPLEVFYIFGGKSKFWAPMTLIFCTKRVFIEVDNW